ncbi:hypothetical protein J5N97_024237 [Dioscorea zingiberensis]|uniref:CCHC-type domain-containing protein n=1 Tax=Dioscorea zingiberensis TaxID=325984 RepID=A0A9D5H8M7_9LILI|nr:hypothetical protein J5N97_024237 [Dioscorea zingiberensis]
MVKAWRRIPSDRSANCRDHEETGIGEQPPPCRITVERSGTSFASVVWGQMEAQQERPASEMAPKPIPEEEWKKVRSKRQYRKNTPPRRPPDPERRQRTPPTILTPSGPAEVCGQCLRSGHRASECRRAMTCRRCCGVGHRAAGCRRPYKPQQGAREPPKQSPPPPRLDNDTFPPLPRSSPPPQKQNNWHSTELGEEEPEDEEHHYTTVSLTEEMLDTLEEMKIYTIVTVMSLKCGMVTNGRLAAALMLLCEADDQWTVQSFRDGRFMVCCPSPERARWLEAMGTIMVPDFSFQCHLWSPDFWNPGQADGVTRWVTIQRLPRFCWKRDSMTRLLKPIGEVIYIDKKGGSDADDARAAIRVRSGRSLPCSVTYNIASRKHTYRVVMEPGQDALPWGRRRSSGKRKRELEQSKEKVLARNQKTNKVARQEERERKGKAVMQHMEKLPEKKTGARATGIVIHDRTEDWRNPGDRDDCPAVPHTRPPSDRCTKAPRECERSGAAFASWRAALVRPSPVQTKNRARFRSRIATASQEVLGTWSANPMLANFMRANETTSLMEPNGILQAQPICDPSRDELPRAMQMVERSVLENVLPSMTNVITTSNESNGPSGPLESYTVIAQQQPPDLLSLIQTGMELGLDINKIALRFVNGTCTMVSDEAWAHINARDRFALAPTTPQPTTGNHMDPGDDHQPKKRIGQITDINTDPPKPRGRPKKLTTTVKETPGGRAPKRRSKRLTPDDTPQDLVTIPVALGTWSDNEILTTATTLGINTGQGHNESLLFLQQIRQKEQDNSREGKESE